MNAQPEFKTELTTEQILSVLTPDPQERFFYKEGEPLHFSFVNHEGIRLVLKFYDSAYQIEDRRGKLRIFTHPKDRGERNFSLDYGLFRGKVKDLEQFKLILSMIQVM